MRTRFLAVAVLCAAAAHAGSTAAYGQARTTLPAADRGIRLDATTVYRVGAADGQPWETFGGIIAAAFDDAGNLYVLDAGNLRVVVFDPAGRHLRSFGRRGGGPGEFQGPIGLAIASDGSVVVNDAAHGALIVLTPEGEHLRNIPMGEVRALSRIATSGDGVVAETRVPQQRLPPDQMRTSAPRSVGRISLAGAALQPLYNAPPQAVEQQALQAGGTRFIAMTPPALSARLQWATLADGGIAATHTDEYRVVITDAAGSPRRVIERPLQPRTVTQRDRDAYLARMAATPSTIIMSGAPAGAGTPTVSAGQPPAAGSTVFADRIQVIQALAADPQDRLWISRSDREGAALIDIVTADGRYLGTLSGERMPVAFGPDGVAAWIERDDLDVQRIVVRRVALTPAR
jgi:hypothetical protein